MTYENSHTSAEAVRAYEDTYTSGYYHQQWVRLERPLLERLFTQLVSAGAESCLDFACGSGRITEVAEDYFPVCHGVDVSRRMLAQAAQRCTRAEFFARDIIQEGLDQQYDVVTAFRFFLNAEASLREAVLLALHTALNDGGVLVANVHVNAGSPLGYVYRLRNWVLSRVVANTLGYTHFVELIEQCGYVVRAVYWYSYLPRTGPWLPSLARVLMSPVEHVATRFRVIPESTAQSFLVVCDKVYN